MPDCSRNTDTAVPYRGPDTEELLSPSFVQVCVTTDVLTSADRGWRHSELVTIVRKVRRGKISQRTEDENGQFVDDSLLHREPMQLLQDWRNMVA